MPSNMKKSLVTGGAGFIGSHLTERLLDAGERVVVVDNYSSGRPGNLAKAAASRRLDVHEADIADPGALNGLLEDVNTIYHLAGLSDIVPSIEDPAAYHRSNVTGTLAVLEAARAAGVARFLYAASSSCYGIPDQYPTPETSAIRPMYPYALTKYLGEQYSMYWAQIYGMSCVSLRLFNVYGPRVRSNGGYGAMFGVFMAQKLAGLPLTIVGDGRQKRDFTYVSDVVDAIMLAARQGRPGAVYNVGSGDCYEINRVAALLGGDTVQIPKRPGEPDKTYADVSLIARELGWTPKVSLENGIQFLLEHIEDWRDAPVWTPDLIKDATSDWFAYLEPDRRQGGNAG